MEYKGKIYGKVGKGYFPLEMTTEDVDRLTLLTEEKDKRIKEFKEWHNKRDRFNQITWIELDNKINELLTKHKQ